MQTAIDTTTKVEQTQGDWARAVEGLRLDQFPRLVRLRRAILAAQPTICTQRPRLVTEFFRAHGFGGGEPVLRQARMLEHVLAGLETPVFDDELIVGSTTGHRLGCMIFPEFVGLVIWPELTSISSRELEPVAVSEEDIDLLADEVFPFWRHGTVHEHVRREGDNPRWLRIAERLMFYMLPKSNCISHIIPNYPALVDRGLLAIAQEADERAASATDPKTVEFQRATSVVCRAVIKLAGRYADACERRAKDCEAARASELRGIAAVLRRVPARRAETLHEALQAVWLTQVALHQENSDAALSFGRLDQVFDRPYRADLAAGRHSERTAAELMGSFFVKMQDHTPLVPTGGQSILGGSATNQAVTVGGQTPAGEDAVNPATFLMLQVSEMLSLREPNLCARLYPGSSREYRDAIARSIRNTGAAPACYNDEAVVTALTAAGNSPADARDYGVIGCVETTSAGRTMGMTGAIVLNIAAVLELALNDGVYPASGVQIGKPGTGKLADFRDYAQVQAAFNEQLQYMIGMASEGNFNLAKAHELLHPTPLLSALIDGTAESGRDVTAGGAKYNSSGVAIIGFADVVDSLAALKHLVFSEGGPAPAQVAAALRADYKGHEKLHTLLTRKAPKYGTDNDAADDIAVALVERIGEIFDGCEAPRGGRYTVGYWSVTMHAGFGALTGALPNGRRRGASLSSGATPVSGVATAGPTASLASTAKLPAERMANCIATNHKFSRRLLNEPGKLPILTGLVDGFFRQGGMQVQFTVQDRETLLAAQKNPDAYRDLMVRVSGYSAYFTNLPRRMQQEIIDRTENSI